MNKGFTLVELAIVLVVIGLLVGGVLSGQELVKQAKIRNVIAQIEEINRATLTFRLKYNKLPGDINNASALGLNVDALGANNVVDTADSARNGDGDGVIEDYSVATGGSYAGSYTGEMANFWSHLSNSGLIKGTYSQQARCTYNATGCAAVAGQNFPKAPLGNGIVLYTSRASFSAGLTRPGHFYIIGVGSADIGNSNYFGQILGAAGTDKTNSAFSKTLHTDAAYVIDSKIDDGDAITGKTFAARARGPQDDVSSASGCFTTDAGGKNNYNVGTVAGDVCTLAITT